MFLNKLDLYYNTLKHVKPTQLFHQVFYRLRNRFKSKTYNGNPSKVVQLHLKEGISYPNSYLKHNTFNFLNLEKQYSEIDWNFSEYRKLWTYNLNYFEFLHQEGMTKEEGLRLLREYISARDSLKDGLEPYPISLRGINWIKFLAENDVQDKEVNIFLFRDYQRLADSLEYHLLANHLLENGFSLLFGAYYFEDERFYTEAKKILQNELEEQILKDGAHYELSPMYHQIILHRVLDSYNLVRNNSWKSQELLSLLKEKAEMMLGWLEEIQFRNGEIPKVNDSSNGIAPTSTDLFEYAKNLGIKKAKGNLKESGYRKLSNEDFEVLMDVGEIAPTYQPGHSHADSLQFLLNFKNRPIVVDTGISTYEKNERRQLERSTASHNTVTINDLTSSEVWGGFRVARRARVEVLSVSTLEIEAQHDGYRNLGFFHNRRFSMQNSDFVVEDNILNKPGKAYEAKGHLHFHPDVQVKTTKNTVTIDKSLMLELSGISKLELKEYQFAEGFNKLRPASKIEYTFNNNASLKFHAASATN